MASLSFLTFVLCIGVCIAVSLGNKADNSVLELKRVKRVMEEPIQLTPNKDAADLHRFKRVKKSIIVGGRVVHFQSDDDDDASV